MKRAECGECGGGPMVCEELPGFSRIVCRDPKHVEKAAARRQEWLAFQQEQLAAGRITEVWS